MRKSESDILKEIDQFIGRIYPGTSLVVRGFAGRGKRNEALVECSSESKGIFIARWNDVKRGLVSGNVRGESRVKRNRYEEKEDSVIVFFNSGGHFVCDKEDIELVKSRTWYLNSNGYARDSNGEYFHKLLIDTQEGYVVDHINRNKLDNRKNNLRVCSPSDNSHNMSLFCTNNTGHTGVYARKNGKYSAVIVADYKTIRLGTFETFEEACKAYDIGKEKYHVIER